MQLIHVITSRYQLQVLFISFLGLILSGCFSTPQTRNIVQNNFDLPKIVEHTQTTFYPQKRFQCGPASLATALDSIHHHHPLSNVVKRVYLPGRKGSLKSDLLSATRRYGLVAYKLKPELTDLLTELADGKVVIVFQNLGIKLIPRWHYAVAIGYNLKNKTIILRSGKHKRRITRLKLFERTWKRSKYWAIVVTPANKIPKTATALRWLSALALFEKHSPTTHKVVIAYDAAISRWPNNTLLHLATANFAFNHKRYRKANRHYHMAVRLDPTNGDAWNNIANLMLKQKQFGKAKRYSRKAINIGGPNVNIYRRTYNEILSKTNR